MEGELEDKWVRVGEVNTHYKVAGRGSPLILLHGGANDWQEWEFNIRPLSLRYRVYAPDLAGYGLTDRLEGMAYTISYFVDFLHHFMANLDLGSVILAGHSLGGMVALNFALRFPQKVKYLILVDSAGLGNITLRGRFIALAAKMVQCLWRGGKSYPSIESKDFQESLITPERLSDIKVPTLIVWGEKDRYFPPDHAYIAHRLLPNSYLHIFKRCGHAPQRERIKEFNQLVLDFLDGER